MKDGRRLGPALSQGRLLLLLSRTSPFLDHGHASKGYASCLYGKGICLTRLAPRRHGTSIMANGHSWSVVGCLPPNTRAAHHLRLLSGGLINWLEFAAWFLRDASWKMEKGRPHRSRRGQ
jgi:hypothetical protein